MSSCFVTKPPRPGFLEAWHGGYERGRTKEKGFDDFDAGGRRATKGMRLAPFQWGQAVAALNPVAASAARASVAGSETP